MKPEGFEQLHNPSEDPSEKNERRIRGIFHDFFMYMYKKHKIHIVPQEIIDFSEQHDPEDSPLLLSRHIVHLLITSYISAMNKTKNIAPENYDVFKQITSLVENDLWNFDPNPKYLDLARRFLREIHK